MQAPARAPSLFDNPVKLRVAREAFTAGGVAAAVLTHAALTALAWAFARWMPGMTPRQGGSLGVAGSLLLAQPACFLLAASLLRRQEVVAFWRAHNLLTVVNVVWLGVLIWTSPGFYGVFLMGLLMVWVYHDAWLTGGRDIRLGYAVAAPSLDIALLAGDLGGGRGLLWSWENERGFTLGFLGLQLVLVGLIQWLISWVGRESIANDERLVQQTRLENELALLRREREVVQASAAVLTTGLMASKFGHDVASPTGVLRLDIDELRRRATDLPEGKARDAISEITEEMAVEIDQLMSLSAGLARAIREREELVEVDVEGVLVAAITAMAASLPRHAVPTPTVNRLVAPSRVWVAPGVASTLSNILTNSAVNAPGSDIEVLGREANRWFYVLSFRDHGVDGEAREAALSRIRALLSLAAEATEPRGARKYAGHGVAVVLGRLYLVRYNGFLTVRPPAVGPGLVFDVVLPRVRPLDIPEAENRPEAATLGPTAQSD